VRQLPRQKPMQILTKYREYFKCDETLKKKDIQQFKQVCYEFVEFLKKAMPIMDAQKQRLKKTM